MSGDRARAAAWRADRDEGLPRLQARLAEHLRRRPRLAKRYRRQVLRLRRTDRGSGRDHRRQDQQPAVRLPRDVRQSTSSARPRRRSRSAATPAAPPAARRPPWRDGLLPFAEGTDGGGSIRIPSAWCGVFGYKASFGRVPCVIRPNAFGGASPFLYEGIISRSVEDGALATTLIAGYDPRDPFCLDEKVDFTSAPGTLDQGLEDRLQPRLRHLPGRAGGAGGDG